jgi:hypothetical protein
LPPPYVAALAIEGACGHVRVMRWQ